MKINIVSIFVSVIVAGLEAWMFHSFGFSLLVTLMAGGTLMLSLSFALGVDFKNAGKDMNIKIVTWAAVLLFGLSNLVLGLIGGGPVPVVIVNVLILIVTILILDRLYHAKM